LKRGSRGPGRVAVKSREKKKRRNERRIRMRTERKPSTK